MENLSVVRRTKIDKLKASAARFAIAIAKEKNDPLFTKYHKTRNRFVNMKKSLFRKYRNEALKRARRALLASNNK